MNETYIIKTKRGYLAVVNGGDEKELTDKEAVAEIKRLLKIRKHAGIQLSKLIRDRGLTSASVHHAARILGEGK